MNRFIFITNLALITSTLGAAVSNVRVTDITPTRAVLRFVAPQCSSAAVKVSTSAGLTPLIPDVDPTLFSNANLMIRDNANLINGSDCAFVIGKPVAQLDLTNKYTSRAMQNSTTHYGQVTVGSSTVAFQFRTAGLVAGNSYNEPAPVDPAHPANTAWPYISWNQGNNDTAIDPQTGILFKFATRRRQSQSNAGSFFEFGFVYAGGADCANGNGWTNPCNALADDSASATFTNTLTPQPPLGLISFFSYDWSFTIDDISLNIKGHFPDGATGDDLKLQACLTIDQVDCYGPWVDTAPLPTASADVGQETILVATDFMNGVLYNPGQQAPANDVIGVPSGFVNSTGSTITLPYGTATFPPDIFVPNARVYIGGYDAAHEATITSVASAIQMNVTPAPGTRNSATFLYPHFGFLIRKKTSSSHMLTLQYARVVLGEYTVDTLSEGAGYTQLCSPTLQPSGWIISGATNASPIVMTTVQAHGYSTGDQVVQSLIQGNTAANGTFTITVIDARHYSLNGSSGNGVYDNSLYNGLVYRTSDPLGFECAWTHGGAAPQRYWINPQTGEIRYKGINVFFGGVNTAGLTSSGPPAGLIIGPYTYFQAFNSNTGTIDVVRGQYQGNSTFGWNQENGPCSGPGGAVGGSPCNSTYDYFNTIVPWISDLHGLMTAFDPLWDTECNSGVPGILGSVDNNGTPVAFIEYNLGVQNSVTCYGYLDILNKSILASGRTWKPPGARWQNNHTPNLFDGMDRVIVAGSGMDSGPAVPFNGPYGAFITSGAVDASPTGCATMLAGLGLTNILSVTDSDLCSTVTVSGPVDSFLGASVHHPNATWLVGDWPEIWGPGGEIDGAEFTQLVGVSGFHLVLKRNSPVAHAAGGSMVEFPTSPQAQTAYNIGGPGQNVGLQIWDWKNDPFMTDSACPYGILPYSYPYVHQYLDQGCTVTTAPYAVSGAHIGVFGDRIKGRYQYINDSGGNTQDPNGNLCDYGVTVGSTVSKMLYNADLNYCVGGIPTFSGTTGVHNGNDVQKHINMNGHHSLNPAVSDHFGDGRVFINTPALSTAVPISGNIYKMTGIPYQGVINYDPKRSVIYGFAAHHGFYEISGPGVMLTDDPAHAWNSCIVYRAGECFAGSSVGDVYINCPQCNIWPAGAPNGWGGTGLCAPKGNPVNETRLPCFALYSSVLDKYVRYPLYGRHDPAGVAAQPISHWLAPPNTTNGSWAIRELPDASWAVAQSWVNGVRWELLMAKLGEMPMRDTVNRGEFIPTPVPVSAVPSATNAYVRFGYDPSFRCNPLNRLEACISTSTSFVAGVTHPFMYETTDLALGNYTLGAPCSSGCSVVLPLLTQKETWYQIVWTNASGVIKKTGPMQVMAAR